VGFFDLSLASIGPIAGLIVRHENYAAVFLTGGIAALLALALITVQGHAPPKAL
jgi:predicted MFS family arabinose efflux permease